MFATPFHYWNASLTRWQNPVSAEQQAIFCGGSKFTGVAGLNYMVLLVFRKLPMAAAHGTYIVEIAPRNFRLSQGGSQGG
jgi:hypothetical protein